MTVTAKAIRNHLAALGAGIACEIAVINSAIHFHETVLLYTLGPLVMFLMLLVWVNKVTGIRCPHCNNIYGVSLGLRGWPSVPPRCQSCGASGDDIP